MGGVDNYDDYDEDDKEKDFVEVEAKAIVGCFDNDCRRVRQGPMIVRASSWDVNITVRV